MLETLVRAISSGRLKSNIGCFTELLCTKDSDWESQDEWRLIGKAGNKEKPLRIKNIYLGFDVSIENQNTILELAKVKHFGVYRMKRPKGIKYISYDKLY